MRVMFVGGGRRVSLAKRFIAAGFDVFAYETDPNCPISEVATIVEGKKWNDWGIEQHVLDALFTNNIDIAIPLQDHATVVLARIADKTATKIPTASESVNNMCLNKKTFEEQLSGYDFYPIVKKDHDVIIKPMFGFNSKGIRVIKSDDFDGEIGDGCVAQRYIPGGFEISVDAYFNKAGKMVDAIPRRRLEVQGGEVSKSITLERNASNVNDITRLVGEKFGLVGPTCFQYVIGDNVTFIMEANARFGGGVILSLEAGFDIVSLIRDEYMNGIVCEPKAYDWKNGFSMVRYFQEHFYG